MFAKHTWFLITRSNSAYWSRKTRSVWSISSSYAGCGQRYRWLVPNPRPLNISVQANHDFQMVCLSRLGLSMGRSEVQGIASPGISSQQMTDGNWWTKPPASSPQPCWSTQFSLVLSGNSHDNKPFIYFWLLSLPTSLPVFPETISAINYLLLNLCCNWKCLNVNFWLRNLNICDLDECIF